MTEVRRPILVLGATGRQGGAVAKALIQAKWPVRALVRDLMAPRSVALRDAGVQVVQGSFTDSEAIFDAMTDTHGVFSVLPGNLSQEEEVRIGVMIADLAVKAGVSHFVYSSGASVGEKPTGVARFDAKRKIESHIRTLPLTATIIRPMIFMDMLLNPAFGLDKRKYTFLLKPDQAMQVVAVEDIGRYVATVFFERNRFAGRTLKLASDTVTGNSLQSIFSELSGRTISYSRFPDEMLAVDSDLGQLAKSLEAGPLADHVDLDFMREINPEIISLRSWLMGDGRQKFEEALSRGQA